MSSRRGMPDRIMM